MHHLLQESLLWKSTLTCHTLSSGLPRRLTGKGSACQGTRCKRQEFNPWIRKISCRRKWQPATPVFLPGKSQGQKSLVDSSPWATKGQTWLSDWTHTFQRHYSYLWPCFSLLLSSLENQGLVSTLCLLTLASVCGLCLPHSCRRSCPRANSYADPARVLWHTACVSQALTANTFYILR